MFTNIYACLDLKSTSNQTEYIVCCVIRNELSLDELSISLPNIYYRQGGVASIHAS